MMFLRRRHPVSRSKHKKSRSGRTQDSPKTEKNHDKRLGPPVSALPVVNIDTFLPQQADDASIRQKVLILFDQVELHVDNFYSENSAQLTPEQEGKVSKFGTSVLTKPLAAVLETSPKKVTLIKHCLAYWMANLISPSSPSRGLLPYELSAMLDATKKIERQQAVDQSQSALYTVLVQNLTRDRYLGGHIPLAYAYRILTSGPI